MSESAEELMEQSCSKGSRQKQEMQQNDTAIEL